MSRENKKVIALACSGIGKPFGAVARETVYELLQRVRPGKVATTCLPLLVMEDPEARQLITDNPVITIDGCAKSCALKSLEALGGKAARAYEVIRFLKEHKDLKPEGTTELNEAGKKLAAVSADELAHVIDELLSGEVKHENA